MKALILLIFLLTPFKIFAEVDLAQSLFSAFSAGCQSVGPLTFEATNQANAIRALIESIRNDNDCKDWASNVEILSSQMMGLRVPPQYENINTLSSKITELTDMITLETNATTKALLAEELANLKIQSLYQGQNADSSLWESRTSRLKQVDYYLNTFNSSVYSNSKCINKYPGVLLELGGQLLGTAASSSMWGAAVGTGLIGVGTITNFLIELIRGNLFGATLKKLKTNTLSTAYLCALETVSNTYCNAQNTKKRIEEVAENNITVYAPNWTGLLIIENLFYFNNWMLRVISGTPSGNLATAQIKNEVIDLRAINQKDFEEIPAIIKQGEQELGSSTDEDGDGDSIRYEIVNAIVKKFSVSSFSEETKKTPYVKSFIKDPSCGPLFFFFSTKDERVSKVPPFTRCDAFIQSLGLPVPSISEIKRKANIILQEGKNYVDLRFALIKETDPEKVLLEGEKEAPYDRPSPIELLGITKNYLIGILAKYESVLKPNTAYAINQTIGEINKALEEIAKPLDTGNGIVEAKKAAHLRLEIIQGILAPDNKDTFLAERIKEVVSFELDRKLKDGELPDFISELLLLSINDEIENITRFTSINLETKKYDVLGAMRTSMVNLEVLGKVFDNDLERMFSDLSKDIRKYPNEPSTQLTMDRLCILSLTIPQLEKMKFVKRYCQGRKIESIYAPKEIRIEFDKLSNLPFQNRSCGYFEYLKKNSIRSRYNRTFSR